MAVLEIPKVQRAGILHCHDVRIFEKALDKGGFGSPTGTLQSIQLVAPRLWLLRVSKA